METTINAIYRAYLLENKQSIVVSPSDIKVDSNGIAKPRIIEIIGKTIGTTIGGFISDMFRLMISFPSKAQYIEHSILKASRYRWNFPYSVFSFDSSSLATVSDTPDFIIETIISVVNDYLADDYKQPTAFSVSNLSHDIEKTGVGNYFSYTIRRHLPKLIEDGIVPPGTDVSRISDRDTKIASFMKLQMITEFMNELLKRIKQRIPNFPQEIIRQFFTTKDWKVSIYHNIIYYGMNLDNPNLWNIKKKLGHGSYGNVYEACRVLDCNYVMKYQGGDEYSSENADREIDVMNSAYKIGVSPKLIASYVSDEYSLMIMERMKVTIHDIIDTLSNIQYENLMDNIVDLIGELHEGGIVHCDLHFGNIMLNTELQNVIGKLNSGEKLTELKIIDYGFASDKKLLEDVETTDDMHEFYEVRMIIDALRNLRCDLNSDLFPLLEFYDYSMILNKIKKKGRKAVSAIRKIFEKQAELSGITGCGGGKKNSNLPQVDQGKRDVVVKAISDAIKAIEEEKDNNNKLQIFFDRMLGPSLYLVLIQREEGKRGWENTLLNKLNEFLQAPTVTREQGTTLLMTINIVEKEHWEMLNNPDPVFQKIKRDWFS
jgi:tRNA A-37 threonylcarbamoyl transferase component Bud32